MCNKIKLWIFSLLFFFCCTDIHAQYKFVEEIKTPDTLAADVNVQEIVSEISDGSLCRVLPIYFKDNASDARDLEITFYDLKSGDVINTACISILG